jgi:hypothetical protein
MSVSKFTLPSNAVDGDLSVLARLAAIFAPHEADPVGMSLVVDQGHLMAGGKLVEVARQSVMIVPAPVTNPRIDRVVVDAKTGDASLVNGVEAATPVAPEIPSGTLPVARVRLPAGVTAITNDMITDERDLSPLAQPTGSLIAARQYIAGTYTYTPTPGTRSVIVEVVGAGGSGGGSQAAGGSTAVAGGGGGAGSFARAWLTQGFDQVQITVAAGTPAGAPGAAGSNGATSSFGSLVSAEGGRGGTAGAAVTPPAITYGSNVGPIPVGGNLVAAGGQGGGIGFVLSTNVVMGGPGGKSTFGANSGGGLNGPGSGTTANHYGAGGGGASGVAGSPARSGGAGNGGLIIVYEYS